MKDERTEEGKSPTESSCARASLESFFAIDYQDCLPQSPA